jgi:hypothetical protein
MVGWEWGASRAMSASPSRDLLGVNELHAGQSWSLVQLANLGWSDEVGVGRRQGCCTFLLYRHVSLSLLDLVAWPIQWAKRTTR